MSSENDGILNIEKRHYEILEDLMNARKIGAFDAFNLIDKIYFPNGCFCAQKSFCICSRCTMLKSVKCFDKNGYWE